MRRLLQTLNKDQNREILTLKQFLNAFEYDKYGVIACRKINHEFTAKRKETYE